MDSEDWRLGQGVWGRVGCVEVVWDVWRPCGVKGAPGRDSEKCMGWGRVCP